MRSEEPRTKESVDILALVKQLRARTGGVSIGECRQALEESNLDLDEAAVYLRKRGIARAAKTAARVAAEGLIAAVCLPVAHETGFLSGVAEGRETAREGGKTVCLLALNSETDFVAKNPRFIALARAAATAAAQAASRVSAEACEGQSTDAERRQETDESKGEKERTRSRAHASLLIEAAKASVVDPQKFEDAGLGGLFQQETGGRRGDEDARGASPAPGGRRENDYGDGISNTLGDMMILLSQQFGEKLQISGVEHVTVPPPCSPVSSPPRSCEVVGWYVHGQVAEGVGRAAAVVVLEWREREQIGDKSLAADRPPHAGRLEAFAKLLAMQAVATRPRFVKLSDVTQAEMETERQILRASVAQQFPANPEKVDMVVEGRLRAQLREQALVEQDFLLASQMSTGVLTEGPGDNVGSEAGGDLGDADSKGDSAGATTGARKEKKSENETVTVKEALRRVARVLQCADLDIKDMRLLCIGN